MSHPLRKTAFCAGIRTQGLSTSLDRPALPRSDTHKVPPQTRGTGSPLRQEYKSTHRTISPCPRCYKKQKNKLMLDGRAGLGETVVVSRVLRACFEPPVDLLLLLRVRKSRIRKMKSCTSLESAGWELWQPRAGLQASPPPGG